MKHKALLSFAGLAMLAVLIIVFIQGRQPANAPVSTGSTNDSPAAVQPADDLRMNRVVQHGNYTALVLSLRNYCGKLLAPNADPQRKFVSVDMVIGNQGAQALPAALRDVELVTEEGSTYPLERTDCAPSFAGQEIPANGLLRGQLVFVIPAGNTPKLVRYTLGDTAIITGLRY
jgi:hypothetical protein